MKTAGNWTWKFVLSGIAMVLGSVVLHFLTADVHNAHQSHYSLWDIAARFLEIAGIALAVTGALNILIELKDWKDYFGERIKEVVLDHSYISGLDLQSLQRLRTNTAKAMYNSSHLDEEGGFFRYILQIEKDFMSNPYRENVSYDIKISEETPSAFGVTEEIEYVCRAHEGKIQRYIGWIPDYPSEYLELVSLEIAVVYPYDHPKRTGTPEVIFVAAGADAKALTQEGKRCDLEELMLSVDRLKVVIKAQYQVLRSRFQTWGMAHPTKNFSFTVRYPEKFKIQFEPLLPDQNFLHRSEEAGYSKMSYNAWVLPGSTVAWRVYEETQSCTITGRSY